MQLTLARSLDATIKSIFVRKHVTVKRRHIHSFAHKDSNQSNWRSYTMALHIRRHRTASGRRRQQWRIGGVRFGLWRDTRHGLFVYLQIVFGGHTRYRRLRNTRQIQILQNVELFHHQNYTNWGTFEYGVVVQQSGKQAWKAARQHIEQGNERRFQR